MSRNVLTQSSLSLNRRQPLLERPEKTLVRQEKRRVGEVAGGAAADCAAIWCCCPCMTVNLLVLAVYKVPTAIVRKAWRKQRRRMLKKNNAVFQQQQQQQHHNDNGSRPSIDSLESSIRNETSGEEEEDEFEKQMWDQFYGTGFWRSPSQRDI